jgi:uncharacterized membrane protein YsdA (DUF1294 family)
MFVLIIYLGIINVIAFLMYGIDKRKAIKNRWRVKESGLLLLSIIGGGFGSLIGMRFFHHKTKKVTFKIGVPILTAISVVYLYYIFGWLN